MAYEPNHNPTNDLDPHQVPRQGVPLSEASISSIPSNVLRYSYDRSQLRPGIVHIGVGNFFRAHEALYVEKCLHVGGQNDWGIVGIGLGEGPEKLTKARAIKAQNGLYTLTEYAPTGDVVVRVVGAMIEYMHAPSETESVLARIAAPETRIVSLTIAEGGYKLDEKTKQFVTTEPSVQHDLANPSEPRTVFGYIVVGLARRKQAGRGGFTVLSCDNLRSNGKVSHTAILSFAKARDPELAAWIEENVSFPNSMVDRIAASVGPAEKAKTNASSGIRDQIPLISESFTQWVVEDKFISGRPALENVGVELRDDFEQFEFMKGRLLNASHMMLSYPALMCGFRIVHEALREPAIVAYLDAFLQKDVMPLVKGPDGVSLDEYRRNIISRFENPAIGDQLLRIANNGVAKLPIFLSKTLSELMVRGGPFDRIALCLASFAQYLKGCDVSGGPLTVDEPHLTVNDKAILHSNGRYSVLRLSPFEPLALAEDAEFVKAFDRAQEQLHLRGAIAALNAAAHAGGQQ